VDFTGKDRNRIDEDVRSAACRIIRGKGATSHGIGAAVAHIVDAVAHEKETILTLCRPLKQIADVKHTTVSLPHLIRGRDEIVTLPLQLSEEENRALADSAAVIRKTIDQIA
jgi:L-lactate dehydrogenase